jgi:hypothetical protein
MVYRSDTCTCVFNFPLIQSDSNHTPDSIFISSIWKLSLGYDFNQTAFNIISQNFLLLSWKSSSYFIKLFIEIIHTSFFHFLFAPQRNKHFKFYKNHVDYFPSVNICFICDNWKSNIATKAGHGLTWDP